MGYELVAFDIPPGKPGQKRIIGWEVWPPKTKALGSADEYVRRLQELMGENDAFDELIETLEADRSIKREEMRQIASGILGYDVPKNRSRFANLTAIRRRPARAALHGAGRDEGMGPPVEQTDCPKGSMKSPPLSATARS